MAPEAATLMRHFERSAVLPGGEHGACTRWSSLTTGGARTRTGRNTTRCVWHTTSIQTAEDADFTARIAGVAALAAVWLSSALSSSEPAAAWPRTVDEMRLASY